MSILLFISDDLPRTERLVRTLGLDEHCLVHDLYAATDPIATPDLIISDVAQLTSDAIVRLKRLLEPMSAVGAPFLALAHGNFARTEAQARLMGASEILPATTAVTIVQERIDQLSDQGGCAIAAKLAGEARQFFIQTFFSGQAITPDFARAGTTLISRAVQQAGIRNWIRAVQRFDEATHQHCLLVTGLAAAFATKLGFGNFDGYRLTEAALLHDVGKTKIPLSILNKPGRLTDDEMAVMRTHAALGYDMLEHGGFSREVLQVVRSHHEMLDGSGYPDGLRAPDIPDLVRLVTICDIYAALIERRPYRPKMSSRQAHGILRSMIGRLDGDLVSAFRPIMAAFDPL
ncbi:HD domain-containing phosphohydrolase [Methylobacterium sp. NPDC080182]|uniref:HD domain-containing phosphohydrolase n=1 Tax=Methylobacterium sp. NPDC080182 TaxID=3390590 RepID=UPI003CFF7F4F